jgi:DNA-binding transcriptional ArsR family regulator
MIDQKLGLEIRLLHKRICYALADPKRVLIIYALAEGPLCVNELVEALDVSQPTVSRHLRVLRDRGLVNPERRGTAVYYHLTDRRLIDALDSLRAVLASQMVANADLVQSLS